MLRHSQIAWAIVFGILFSIPIYFVFSTGGKITIERPYYSEYKGCQDKVEQLQRTVQCPEVKCTAGVVGIFWSIIGFVFMAVGMLFWWRINSRYDKKDEELKKREKDVIKAEAELYKKSKRKR